MSDAASSTRPTTIPPTGDAGTVEGGRRSSRTADLAYSAFYGGAIGGSVIAIFFLVLDAVQGQPLFTPSLIGTAFFTAADPGTVSDVRVDMVAYFSLVHFAAFFALGAVASRLHLTVAALRSRTSLAVFLFGLLTVTLYLADVVLMRGAISALGFVQVLVANAITAWVMASFIVSALAMRPEAGDAG